MQYFLMCCIDETHWAGLPEGHRERVMRDYAAWIRDLDGAGRHLASGRLQPSSSATTVRMRNGRRVITDGPFAETKEQFGGYHLIDCADLDEAISIASRIPTLPVGGTVEVRPVASDGG